MIYLNISAGSYIRPCSRHDAFARPEESGCNGCHSWKYRGISIYILNKEFLSVSYILTLFFSLNFGFSKFLQTSLQLGSKLLTGLGVMSDDVSFLRQLVRDSMELQAQEAVGKTDNQELNAMKPMQVFPHQKYSYMHETFHHYKTNYYTDSPLGLEWL